MRRKLAPLLPSHARGSRSVSWQGRPLFLRHCVYSRYASFKNEATAGICVGQELLGLWIVRIGQDAGGHSVGLWCPTGLQALMIYCLLLAHSRKGVLQAYAFKTMEKWVHNNKPFWVSDGTLAETCDKTQLRRIIFFCLACVLWWV